MGRPSISLVIPTYNSGHLVVDAIDSALNQTDPADEVIVIDDGSTDGTPGLLAHYGDRIRLVVQTNGGASSARNHGIRLSKSDCVAFLDADDVWHPRKLEIQRKVMANHPDIGLLGSLMIDWPAAEFPAWNELDEASPVGLCWEKLVIKYPIGTPTTVARRSVLDQLGGFDETLKSGEDRDLWIRFAEISSLAYLPLQLVGCRRVEGSLSNRIGYVKQRFAVLRKIDARDGWRGRWLLRRKAYGYSYFGCAYFQSIAGKYAESFASMFLSFWWYPLPFARNEVNTPLARVKGLIVYTLRMLGLKAPQPKGFTAKVHVSSGDPAAAATSSVSRSTSLTEDSLYERDIEKI